jgi:hypothetical protein
MVDAGNQQVVVMLRNGSQQMVGAAHRLPVVFVSRPTTDADLVVTAIGTDARPGKLVFATISEKFLQQIQWVTP